MIELPDIGPWKRIERIGDAVLLLGDCLEILPTLPKVDAVITDPPYGIEADRRMAAVSGTQYGRAAAPKAIYEASGWDDQPMSAEHSKALMRAAPIQVFWGGNYYGLPAARCWFVWDKQNGDNAFADCELAWTNLDKPVRIFRWMWNGMLRQGGEKRVGHPTQKPVALMEWCIKQADSPALILDAFAGSGTTGVACMNLGRKFIGIEIEERYFNIAVERITNAQRQERLFPEAPAPQQAQHVIDLRQPEEGA